jgi:hypothetical protein
MKLLSLITVFVLLSHIAMYSQTPLITDMAARKTTSLNGTWQYTMR